jgi:hypothetical protein
MNREGEEMRDDVLRAALSRLEVPEHGPGFEARLRAWLEEDVARRESLPGSERVMPFPPSRRRRVTRRRLAGLPAAATVVVAAIVVAVTIGEPGVTPRVATAAEIRGAVARAWATADSVRGILVSQSSVPPDWKQEERRWRFVMTAQGDVRLTGITRPGDTAYDADDNIERGLNPSESIPDSDVLFGSEIRGLAPGPPDQTSSITALDRGLGSVVRALAVSRGGGVRETTYEGREAWLLETDLPVPEKDEELWPDHLEVVVDQETGFPLRAIASNNGQTIYETRIEDLEVGGALPQDAFTIGFPPGVEVFRSDAGFRRVSLDEARFIVGYDPLVPRSVPEGYELSEVAVAKRAGATGAFESNPDTIKAVSLSYRRGLDQFVVTTRLVGDSASAWSDPFATGEDLVRPLEQMRFSSGALAGRNGELVIDPLAEPHVWALTQDLVVTVSGDLTHDELLQVAESLGTLGEEAHRSRPPQVAPTAGPRIGFWRTSNPRVSFEFLARWHPPDVQRLLVVLLSLR